MAVLVFGFGSYMFFDKYAEKHKKIELVSGIVFALMAFIKIVDLIIMRTRRGQRSIAPSRNSGEGDEEY